MRKSINIILCLVIVFSYFYLPIDFVLANTSSWVGYTNISGSLTIHSTPALGNFNYVEEIPPYMSFRVIGQEGDFYKIIYGDDNKEGWIYYQTIKKSEEFKEDSYGRPWTTPGKAIIGGAKMIAQSYISKGQFTSYLKKFQVNPNASAGLYNHQYMTNIRAPYYESRTSYKGYSQFLEDVTFTFTIPIFNNMPEETILSGMTLKGAAMTYDELVLALEGTEYSAETFEAELDLQQFPENYKKYLRSLYVSYPKWKFLSLNTGIEWETAVVNEIPKSCIEVSSGHGTNEGCGNESSNWAMADSDAVRYFMDPRNFLDRESIFMFEDLSSNDNVTESTVQRILTGTFMSGLSEKDNMNYATIFLNAGKDNGINSVYLASLSLQEVGTGGSFQTTGESFDWFGLRYSSLYNFYNIGATGQFTAKGGLVWASGGSPDVFQFVNEIEIPSEEPIEPEVPEVPITTNFESIITGIGYKINDNFIKDIKVGTKVSEIKTKIIDVSVSILDKNGVSLNDDQTIGTGSTITLSDGTNSYSKVVIINGDINGDGDITSRDYIMIEEKLLETVTFDSVQITAGDLNADLRVNSRDYIMVEEYLLNK